MVPKSITKYPMNYQRVEVILLVVDRNRRFDLHFGHNFSILLFCNTVLKSFNADDEIVGEFGNKVFLNRLSYSIITFYFFSLQKSHTKSCMISLWKDESIVS
jgi:hypothetical protein